MSVGSDVVSRFDKRRRKIREVNRALKSEFVGLDEVIDRICEVVEHWYCAPDMMNRPTIINLWGMTGVGKTALVRRLVTLLDMISEYLEVPMNAKGVSYSSEAYYGSHSVEVETIEDFLKISSIQEGEPGILFLDEMQKFRTVSRSMDDVRDLGMQDIWSLLSDGRIPVNQGLKRKVTEQLSRIRRRKSNLPEVEFDSHGLPDDVLYYDAEDLKYCLKMKESIEEIMSWNKDYLIKVAERRLRDKDVYEARDYSKLLIFISGNLDEAYPFCGETSSMTDADIFYGMSKKISVMDIKRALVRRFTPEQISRFGNNHVVYPSFSKASYERIIRKELDRASKDVLEKYGVDLAFDETVEAAVYRNGVFPVQGVRPVLSTLSSMVYSHIPKIAISAIRKGQDRVDISHVEDNLVYTINDRKKKIPCRGDADTVGRNNADKDLSVCIGVHEAGHAVGYAVEFGLAPSEISLNTTDFPNSGLVISHDMVYSREMVTRAMTFMLAGRAAEEMVFERDNLTIGGEGDLGEATELAGKYFKRWGFYEGQSCWASPNKMGVDGSEMHCERDLSSEIESMVRKAKDRADALVRKHALLIRDVADSIIENKVIPPEEFVAICKRNNVKVSVAPTDKMLVSDFSGMYDAWRGRQG